MDDHTGKLESIIEYEVSYCQECGKPIPLKDCIFCSVTCKNEYFDCKGSE